MRSKTIQEFRLNGHRVFRYDGRYKHQVSKYDYERKNLPEKQWTIFQIDGSIHIARKNLGGCCISCMKPVLKGQVYVLRNQMIFAETFRSHLDCLVREDLGDPYYVKSIRLDGIYKIHEVIKLTPKNLKEFHDSLTSPMEV